MGWPLALILGITFAQATAIAYLAQRLRQAQERERIMRRWWRERRQSRRIERAMPPGTRAGELGLRLIDGGRS